MVLNESDADQRAEKILERLGAEFDSEVTFFDGAFGIPTREDHGDVYIYNWNSAAYVRSGNIMDQLLSGPIAVPKSGAPAFVLGTASDTEGELRRRREQA